MGSSVLVHLANTKARTTPLVSRLFLLAALLLTLCLSDSAGSSSQAERQAVNTICQGSAADLVKLAMIQLHKQLQQQFPAGTCKLLLQVSIACISMQHFRLL